MTLGRALLACFLAIAVLPASAGARDPFPDKVYAPFGPDHPAGTFQPIDVDMHAGEKALVQTAGFEREPEAYPGTHARVWIDWGDGTESPGYIKYGPCLEPPGPDVDERQPFLCERTEWQAIGSHTYSQPGEYQVTTRVIFVAATPKKYDVIRSTARVTTRSAPGTAVPQAVTAPVEGLAATEATLRGEFHARGLHTGARFEYGETPQLGHVTGPAGASTADGFAQASFRLTGLRPGKTYYYRLVAERQAPNAARGDGETMSFVTPAAGGEPSLAVSGQQGGNVELSATGYENERLIFVFDVDGNGSFETSCDDGKVIVAYPPGTQWTPAYVTKGPDGKTTPARSGPTIGSHRASAAARKPAPKAPAPTTGPRPAPVLAMCPRPNIDFEAQVRALKDCPTTMRVGVLEAIFPPTAPKSACFKHVVAGKSERYEAPPNQAVQANGLHLEPELAANLLLDVNSYRFRSAAGSKSFMENPPLALVKVTIPGSSSNVTVNGKAVNLPVDVGASIDWDITKQGTVTSGGATKTFSLVSQKLLAKFAGLNAPQVGPIGLTARGALIPITLKLPEKLVSGVSGAAILRTDNTEGLRFDGLSIHADRVPFGKLFSIAPLDLSYSRTDDRWSGRAQIRLPNGAGVDARFVLENGQFKEAGGGARFVPGVPLGCCAALDYLGGSWKRTGSDGMVISGDLGLIAGPRVAGRAAMGVGGTFSFFDRAPWAMSLSGSLSVVDQTLGTANVTYTHETSVTARVNLQRTFWNVLKVTGDLFADVYLRTNTWQAGGVADVCVDFKIANPCAGGGLLMSSRAATGCLYFRMPGATYGDGIVKYWDRDDPEYYAGCGYAQLKQAAGAAQVGGERVVTVPQGLPAYRFEATGTAGPPVVTVTGPDGRTITTDGPGVLGSQFFVYKDERTRTTYVNAARPPAGKWRVVPAAGSALTALRTAEGLHEPKVRATVRRLRHRWELRYSAEGLGKGERLRFAERATQTVGGGRPRGEPGFVLGETRRSRGVMRFAPGEADAGVREIEATILGADGLPRRILVAGRYRAPRPAVPRRPIVRLRQRGKRLVLTWSRDRRVLRYRVLVNESTGRRRFFERPAKSRRLVLQRVSAGTRVTATVTGTTRSLRTGRAGRATLKVRRAAPRARKS
ncbi:MAG TPA: hypothetical protein VHF88_01730 [Thermoleophilaceae bacterium]|nr:hypothetical protein [Thermoleophilaceae bacterium]